VVIANITVEVKTTISKINTKSYHRHQETYHSVTHKQVRDGCNIALVVANYNIGTKTAITMMKNNNSYLRNYSFMAQIIMHNVSAQALHFVKAL
jgi:hypothetical protein